MHTVFETLTIHKRNVSLSLANTCVLRFQSQRHQIDGMPHFTLFDHVHTIYERSSPTFFFPFLTKSWELSAKNGHQKTGKVHQVSKVTQNRNNIFLQRFFAKSFVSHMSK